MLTKVFFEEAVMQRRIGYGIAIGQPEHNAFTICPVYTAGSYMIQADISSS